MPPANLHAGWGRFGSLTWHENMLFSLESVEDVNQYLLSLDIECRAFTDLNDAKVEALRLLHEREI